MENFNFLSSFDWEYEYSRDEIFYEERQQQIINEFYLWENVGRAPAEIEVIIPFKLKKNENKHNTLPLRGIN
jgi:hypothetical protein